MPFVSVVHDLTAVTHPEWHSAADARRLRAALGADRRAGRPLRLRLGDDRAGARRDATRRRAPGSRVVPTAWIPISRRRRTDRRSSETRRRYAGGRRYILYLGTLEPRKNVETLVAACERLWSRSARARRISCSPAAPAGRLPPCSTGSRARPSGTRSTSRATPAASDRPRTSTGPRRSSSIRRSRRASVCPSLEAMACGTPVVASTAEALREVAGDAALFAAAAGRRGVRARDRARPRGSPRLASASRPRARRARRTSPGRRPPGSTAAALAEARRGAVSARAAASASTRASSRTSGSAPTSATSSRRSSHAARVRAPTASASTRAAPTARRCRTCPPHFEVVEEDSPGLLDRGAHALRLAAAARPARPLPRDALRAAAAPETAPS